MKVDIEIPCSALEKKKLVFMSSFLNLMIIGIFGQVRDTPPPSNLSEGSFL